MLPVSGIARGLFGRSTPSLSNKCNLYVYVYAYTWKHTHEHASPSFSEIISGYAPAACTFNCDMVTYIFNYKSSSAEYLQSSVE